MDLEVYGRKRGVRKGGGEGGGVGTRGEGVEKMRRGGGG